MLAPQLLSSPEQGPRPGPHWASYLPFLLHSRPFLSLHCPFSSAPLGSSRTALCFAGKGLFSCHIPPA